MWLSQASRGTLPGLGAWSHCSSSPSLKILQGLVSCLSHTFRWDNKPPVFLLRKAELNCLHPLVSCRLDLAAMASVHLPP